MNSVSLRDPSPSVSILLNISDADSMEDLAASDNWKVSPSELLATTPDNADAELCDESAFDLELFVPLLAYRLSNSEEEVLFTEEMLIFTRLLSYFWDTLLKMSLVIIIVAVFSLNII